MKSDSEGPVGTYERVRRSGWFDDKFYLRKYPDVAAASIDPLRHYLTFGGAEHRQPHPNFDVWSYLEQCAQRGLRPANALLHFLDAGRFLGLDPARTPERSEDRPDDAFVRRTVARNFDYAYYLSSHPDVREAGIDPVQHYLETGWREGRNPSAEFDTSFYLDQNPDVGDSGINPFFHYIVAGRGEGRASAPSTGAENAPLSESHADTPNSAGAPTPQVTVPLSAEPESEHEVAAGQAATADDFVRATVAPHFDEDHYMDQLESVELGGLSALDHFLSVGWKQALNPCAGFETRHYLSANRDVADAGVNPFFHYIVAGREEGRAPTSHQAQPDDFVAKTVSDAFDPNFYLEKYPDIRKAGVDPLTHFLSTGWREGRDPCWGFETSYYLEQYPDVRDAGINPFFHFIVAGAQEGRLPRDPLSYEIRVLREAKGARTKARSWKRVDPASAVTERRLRAALTASLRRKRRVVSFSHDNYLTVLGGIQNCVSDEEKAFAKLGFDYVHIYPAQPLPHLSDATNGDIAIHFSVNGEPIGRTTLMGLAKALLRNPVEVYAIVHSLLGHSPEIVAKFSRTIGAFQVFFWIHDFFSHCESHALLRNDLTFCHSPPPGSPACSVCVYGESRSRHIARFEKFFRATRPVVISPSEIALKTWSSGHVNLPATTRLVVPHCSLLPGRIRIKGTGDRGPIRVAYLGYDSYFKGWATFERLSSSLPDQDLEFFHFGKRTAPASPVCFVPVEVSRGNRSAMLEAVEEFLIDVVVIWPAARETFSFVAYEALAAGALVVTHSDSGNVAPVVRDLKAGWVVEDEPSLLALLASDAFRSRINQHRKVRLEGSKLIYSGCTAALFKKGVLSHE